MSDRSPDSSPGSAPAADTGSTVRRDHEGVATHDATRIDDRRIAAVRALLSPAMLEDDMPVSAAAQATVREARSAIAAILQGDDDRMLVVVGPCSIHDTGLALDYAERLGEARARHARDLLLVMRVYFEKPRTTVGWKGLINDPRIDGSFRINDGLRLARRLLIDLAARGVPAGTEFLDLLTPQYFSDLIAWAAIGARTTESQTHRQLASGLSCPVGFKNGTDGSIRVAVDALQAARAAHSFMGMTKMGVAAIFETRGNEACHLILRGGSEPNYGAAHVDRTCSLLAGAGLPERLMIDFSHANSGKQFDRQMQVADDVATRVAAGDARLVGAMIESHLREGRQDAVAGRPLEYGVSITDACLGWPATETVLRGLARAVQARRALRAR